MARKDKDFLGLEVVSLEDASVVGEVDALLVDDGKVAVVGLVIDLGVYEAKVLAFSDILSIGEDAVMIGASSAVKPISQHAALEAIAERDVQVSDTLAMTDRGNLVGIAGDYFVDAASGAIKGLEILPEEIEDGDSAEAYLVPIADVLRVSAELIMLKDGFEGRVVASADAL
ncbi:MAG: PRC-barrel domain-containing protein [Thermoleophilia bacterium]